MEAAHTRIETMLGHEYVTDIVGQSKTTINFNQVLDRNLILLVKLSTHLSDESKRIIGTILISELLHAIQHRSTRNQFCIYIDEFQNFAGFQDFPVLITQAPKFGIATTLAHHERYGQLANNPQIAGATAAIANKVLFQITPRDAHELAPEFANAPPKEIKREDQFIISRAPVWDLLKWHDNPRIREYVNKYIRQAEKGSVFFRIVISPDGKQEDTAKDLYLWQIAEQTMLTLEERLNIHVPFAAVEHNDHTGNRHVHLLACLKGRIEKGDLKALRDSATQAALFQRQERDLARETKQKQIEEVQWAY